ncbi:dUTP diphosphatase [Oceanobacillus indicireducens]|uniref:dUTP diphosphatase n=1 Tax=Oceanobacillus indicireducens TaxID=1004261 RepID=A0A917XZF1_9BACI|nr:deoxyuridine 5'-triphosphate nucleotidohydrolase [Oceanobacillus indicireducens]GGN59409.1 dUTP pyrophosphatase [Oceanobacillus indicireducens]
MIKVGFKKLADDAILPARAHYSDSGFDLFANEDVIIDPGETIVVKTGIAINLPDGYEAQVRPRSGVTSKTKLRVQLGTIDNSYTGEICILVDNIHNGRMPNGAFHRYGFYINGSATRDTEIYGSYVIRKGDKLAQLVIQKLPEVHAYEIEKLPETERGSNGFGSSGY